MKIKKIAFEAAFSYFAFGIWTLEATDDIGDFISINFGLIAIELSILFYL